MTIIVAGGAGGDGKTTVLELLAKYFALEAKNPVLAIDANPDQTLLSFLSVDAETEASLPAICENDAFLKHSLEGENPFYPNIDQVTDTSPVTPDTKRWSLANSNDEVMQYLSLNQDGISVMRAGTYNENDIGNGCLHDKIAPLVFMLQRLYDGARGEDGMVLVDNAHGRDAFGTALYAQGDAVLVVARPEKKSLDILRDYIRTGKDVESRIGFPVNLIVIGSGLSVNPDERREEEAALKSLAGSAYIGGFETDPALKRKFSNAGPTLNKLSTSNYRALSSIARHLEGVGRHPERRKAWMEFCHSGATWKDKMIAPGITDQKTHHVPDLHHRHGPHCQHHHH